MGGTALRTHASAWSLPARSWLGGLAMLSALPTAALAGPPSATDDPEPVELRHWEF